MTSPISQPEDRELSVQILTDLYNLSQVDSNVSSLITAVQIIRDAKELASQILVSPHVAAMSTDEEIILLQQQTDQLNVRIASLVNEGNTIIRERDDARAALEVATATINQLHAQETPDTRTLMELRTALERERQLVDHFRSQPIAMTAKPESIPDPPVFSGERKELRSFIAGLRLKVIGNASRFPTDQHQLIYAFGRLGGIAREQIMPYVRTGQIDLANLEALITVLDNAFGDPNRVATAERELRELRQKNRELSLYLADFTRIMADLQWDELAKRSTFENGLSEELKDALVLCNPPVDFNEFVALCQRLDSALRARAAEKKGRPAISLRTSNAPCPAPTPAQPCVETNPNNQGPVPMDLSASCHHLSQEEYDHH